ncbi:hypothetical protein ACFL00_03200 [Pseudomonadota bacterium]
MGKRARKNYRNVSIENEDDFDDLFDDDFDANELSKDIYSTEWGDDDGDSSVNARRKIERRKDIKKLYSQLDEWEEFGKNPESYL